MDSEVQALQVGSSGLRRSVCDQVEGSNYKHSTTNLDFVGLRGGDVVCACEAFGVRGLPLRKNVFIVRPLGLDVAIRYHGCGSCRCRSGRRGRLALAW